MARVSAQSVDGLGWESHQLAVAQSLHGGVELGLRRPQYSYHGQLYRRHVTLFERLSLPAHNRALQLIRWPITSIELQSDHFWCAVPCQ